LTSEEQGQVDSVVEALRECVGRRCTGDSLEILTLRCSEVSKARAIRAPGVYVFVDPSSGVVYYVGQAGDLGRRLGSEHCSAHIGGSEGVVRFLMHILDKICERSSEWAPGSAKEREAYVKSKIREFLETLIIYVAYCPGGGPLSDRKTRLSVEACLKARLDPILNP